MRNALPALEQRLESRESLEDQGQGSKLKYHQVI